MHYKEVMADIETLDTEPSAVTLSIGLVKFNLDETDDYDSLNADGRSLYLVLDAEDQIKNARRTTSFGTIKFWVEQDKQAQIVFHEKRLPVREALEVIVKWVGKPASNLWGNGATFDNMILMSLFEDYGVPFPFRYWENLDLRTLKYMAGSPKLSIPKGIAHHALDDAQYEALCAQEYVRRAQAA